MSMLGRSLLFPKALLVAAITVAIVWYGYGYYRSWEIAMNRKRLGITGLGASAGTLNYLHSPLVVVVLAIAFGVGFYAFIWVSRR